MLEPSRTLPAVRPSRVQAALFMATIVSTAIAYPLFQGLKPWSDPAALRDSLAFSSTLLIILGVHELGHFVVGRYYGVDVSLPYFIPAPNLLGTFGAVIRIRSLIGDRRALLMIGAAGPLAGFAMALPAIVWGIHQSQVTPQVDDSGVMVGAPLVFLWIVEAVHGPLGDGVVLELSGMAFAGWAGLFLTAFNLLPLGQLDGGHIAYALLERRSAWVAWPTVALLVWAGTTLWVGWLMVCLLVLIFGMKHPPVGDPSRPLSAAHVAVASTSGLVWCLSFTPVPIVLV